MIQSVFSKSTGLESEALTKTESTRDVFLGTFQNFQNSYSVRRLGADAFLLSICSALPKGIPIRVNYNHIFRLAALECGWNLKTCHEQARVDFLVELEFYSFRTNSKTLIDLFHG